MDKEALDINTRHDLAEQIARKWSDRADLSEVVSYFFNAQYEYLNDLPDEELLEIANDEEITL